MDCRHFGKAAKCADHPFGHVTFDLDHSDAANRHLHDVGLQDDGVAENDPRALEALDPVADRGARNAEIHREIGEASACVVPQQGDQSVIEVTHLHNGK